MILEVVRTKPFIHPQYPRNARAFVGENASMECIDAFSTTMRTMVNYRWIHLRSKPDSSAEQGMISLVFYPNTTDILRNSFIDSAFYEPIKKTETDTVLYGIRMNLYNVTEDDDGYYSCVACNHLGCSIKSARLTIIPETG